MINLLDKLRPSTSPYLNITGPADEPELASVGIETYRDAIRCLSNTIFTGCITNIINDTLLGVPLKKSIHNTFNDTLPAWFTTDFIIARSIKLAKRVPVIKYIPSEFINSAFMFTLFPVIKFMTSKQNTINQLFDNKDKSEEETTIIEAMKNKPITKLVNKLKNTHTEGLQKSFNVIFKNLLGIKSEKEVNYTHFALGSAAVAAASAFTLGKEEKNIGFESANTPLKALRAFAVNCFTGIGYALISCLPLSLKGMNFDQVYNHVINKNTSYTILHSGIDALASCLKNPLLNPATLGTLSKTATELIIPVFNRSLMRNITPNLKVSENTDYVSHKFYKPIIQGIQDTFRPIFAWLAKNVLSKVGGMYDPKIPGMYDRNLAERDNPRGLPEHLRHMEDLSTGQSLAKLVQTVADIPGKHIRRLKAAA